jgi:Manganese containing catalase
MDIATEEVGHVEMIATMVARLLEGAPATATTKAAAADPVVGAVLGGMDPQQAIVAGGGALLRRPRSDAVGRLYVAYMLPRLMRASWAGNCALPPFPTSLLFDSYLSLVFLGFRSDRLTVLQ